MRYLRPVSAGTAVSGWFSARPVSAGTAVKGLMKFLKEFFGILKKMGRFMVTTAVSSKDM